MSSDPYLARAEDLREWRSQFAHATPIVDATPRQRTTCVGVVQKIRLAPGQSLEVMVEDGTDRLTAVWSGRSSLPGVQLGRGLSLTGTVAEDADGSLRMLNPAWELVSDPYA